MEKQELAPTEDGRAQVIQVMTTMKAVVDQFGRDYVYQRRPNGFDLPTCWYVNAAGDGPDCLVGQVLYRLGVSLDTLREGETGPPGLASGGRLHYEAADVLGKAQAAQDGGQPWGVAYDRAYLVAHNYYPDDFPDPPEVSPDV